MPVKRGYDKKGAYWAYGSQKRYYYEKGNKASCQRAKARADRQARAIAISKARAKGHKIPRL